LNSNLKIGIFNLRLFYRIPINEIFSTLFKHYNFYCDLIVNTDQENLPTKDLTVFPNPATDQLNFQLSENESFLSIRLFQMDGNMVRKLENIRSSNILLKRDELTSGTYFYQVQTLDGNSFSGKIILE